LPHVRDPGPGLGDFLQSQDQGRRRLRGGPVRLAQGVHGVSPFRGPHFQGVLGFRAALPGIVPGLDGIAESLFQILAPRGVFLDLFQELTRLGQDGCVVRGVRFGVTKVLDSQDNFLDHGAHFLLRRA
jgi:hypothetical protein